VTATRLRGKGDAKNERPGGRPSSTRSIDRARSRGSSTAGKTLAVRRAKAPMYRHPVNQMVFDAAPVGARIADRVTGFMGSWGFIVIQTMIVAVWLGANVVLLTRPFDPFPFILLNLAFSTQAAYAAPLILLAGNRSSHRDRLTLEHAAQEGDLADAQNERLLNGNTEILKQVAALEARTLRMEQTILDALGASQGGPPDSKHRRPDADDPSIDS
jgi:uncharacterized membrane protein